MRKSVILSIACAFVLMGTATALAGGECCDKARAANGWCGECKIGYFDGVDVKSEKLHAALTGTEVKAADLGCPGCKKAAESDGTCEHCHVGFAHNHMYKSAVAHTLAKGQLVADIKGMGCKNCEKAAKDHGWCDDCGMGMVGNTSFKERDAYKGAVKARMILTKATKASEKCEGCAVAMVTDGECDHCHVSFKDGEMVKKTEEKPKVDVP